MKNVKGECEVCLRPEDECECGVLDFVHPGFIEPKDDDEEDDEYGEEI